MNSIGSKYPYLNPNYLLFFVIVLIVVTYSTILHSPFVLDDLHSFIYDPGLFIKDFSFKSLIGLSETKFGTSRFIPTLTFAIDHKLFAIHKSITQYHITNIVIHIAVTFAVYNLVLLLFRISNKNKATERAISDKYYAIFIAALWALSPVQTNAVTYTVQRMASIAALFYILAINSYISGRINNNKTIKILFLILTVLFSVCAFVSKENTATIPIAIIFIEILFFSPGFIKRISWKHICFVILMLLMMLPVIEPLWLKNLNGFQIRQFTLGERLLTESRVIIFYISLLLLPIKSRLNLEHDFEISSSLLAPTNTILSILVIITLLAIALKLSGKNKMISFGIIWFFLNLLVESTLIPLELVFEHRLYLPSVGFFIVIVSLVDIISSRLNIYYSRNDLDKLIFVFFIIILSISSLLTSLRNYDWKDNQTLYADCLKKSPNKPRVYVNISTSLADDPDRAAIYLKKAIDLGEPYNETYGTAYANLLRILVYKENYDEAIEIGEKFLTETDNNMNMVAFSSFMLNHGYAYEKKGDYPNALKQYVSGYIFPDPQPQVKFDLIPRINAALTNIEKDPDLREKYNFKNVEDPDLAVYLRFAELMLGIKDYQFAENFLLLAKAINPESKYIKDIQSAIDVELDKNKKAKISSSIKFHPLYTNDFYYRLAMDLVVFISKYYHPLNPFAEFLLNWTENRIGRRDPFIDYYRIRLALSSKKPIGYILSHLESSIEKKPDFLPLLELGATISSQAGKIADAIKYHKAFLILYPGHPDWYIKSKRIVKLNEFLSKAQTQ